MAKYIITQDGGVKRPQCDCNCSNLHRTIQNHDYLSLAVDVTALVFEQLDNDTPVREALQEVADRIKRTVENG